MSPKKLAKTRMAKSVLDAGWSDFKRFLSYKSIRNGGGTLEALERFSSVSLFQWRAAPCRRRGRKVSQTWVSVCGAAKSVERITAGTQTPLVTSAVSDWTRYV